MGILRWMKNDEVDGQSNSLNVFRNGGTDTSCRVVNGGVHRVSMSDHIFLLYMETAAVVG